MEQHLLFLPHDHYQELLQCSKAFIASGRDLAAINNPEHFSLPAGLKQALHQVRQDLLSPNGKGFVLLRGLEVQHPEPEVLAMLLIVAVHLGRPLPQSPTNSLVNHVMNHPGVPRVREHATSAGMGFHSDAQADILVLKCKQQAPIGGESFLVDAGSVSKTMISRGFTTEVATLMGSDFYRDVSRYQFVDQTGHQPYMAMPPFSISNDRLWSTFNANHYLLCAKKYPDTCGLSEQQRQAITVFEETAQELMVKLRLEPGDILFVNNHTMLHARSAFEDGLEPDQCRHICRVWVGCEEMAAVAPPHLAFERCYGPSFDPASYQGLLKPQPEQFHVPLSSEDNGL